MMIRKETSERENSCMNSKENKRRIARRENAKNVAVKFKQVRDVVSCGKISCGGAV